ncbi:ATP-binding protein [Persicobacter psychrovividus]|uniref:histidine kinase n=1 Tax=Persicobacter psychrovividus TaxID=387638 RepID=A0ABN6LIT0_9BACT|nr:hypothetical protein PEPS_40930 [Persicobacter psychrovividus]
MQNPISQFIESLQKCGDKEALATHIAEGFPKLFPYLQLVGIHLLSQPYFRLESFFYYDNNCISEENMVAEINYMIWTNSKKPSKLPNAAILPVHVNTQIAGGITVLNTEGVNLLDDDRLNMVIALIGANLSLQHQKYQLTETQKRVIQQSKLMDNSPNPILVIDEQCTLLYTNPASDHLLTFYGMISGGQVVTSWQQAIRKILKGATEVRFQVRTEDKVYSLSFFRHTHPHLITVYANDITELKKLENSLVVQRNFFEDIFNHIPSDLVVFNKRHEYLFVNPQAIKNRQIREWIIGKTDYDYCDLKNTPYDMANARRDLFNRIKNSRQVAEIKDIKYHEDRSIREAILRRMLPVYDKEGELEYMIGYGSDITDLMRAENASTRSREQLELVLTASNDGFWDWDLDTGRLFLSDRLKLMLGIEMLGNSVSSPEELNLLSFKNRFSFFRSILKLKNGHLSKCEAIHQFTHAKGGDVYLLMRTIGITNKEGHVVRIVGSSADISELKRSEIALQQAKKFAEQANEAQTQFLATMSHEIRTPLNAVIGFSNFLLQENPQPHQLDYLNSLNFSANNLLSLVNDILDFNKIEAKKIELEHIGFDLHDLGREVIQVMNLRAADKGIYAKVEMDPHLPKRVMGDPTRLSQIFNNLLGNAIKFTDQGGIKLKMSLLSEEETCYHILFEFEDTGIGISKEKFEKIFDSFSQADNKTTRKYGGTGLGLTITRKLIELLGGEIKLKSEESVGSTFYFCLKMDRVDDKDFENQKIKEIFDEKQIEGVRILLVDDNPMNIRVAKHLLDKWKAKVDVAENGAIAVDMAQENDYDLIFMDLSMPVMDGYEATICIRVFDQVTPIIALTADALSDVRARVFSIGMNDFMTKPFKPAVLKEKLSINLLVNKPD